MPITHDDLTPFLRRAAQVGTPAGRHRILRTLGTTLLSVTKGTHSSHGASLRAAVWKAKRDGTPSTLRKRGLLWRSWNLTTSPDFARINNPTIYASIHQFGGVIRPKEKKSLRFQSGGQWWTVKSVTMPPRPMIPMTPDGRLTPAATRLLLAAGQRTLSRILGGQIV
jgi:phage gpG-like protein